MIHAVRSGSGRKLLLIHGLGGSQRSWGPIVTPSARSAR
jgi:pimeloyl-ACP methyl ester carboxylesterase